MNDYNVGYAEGLLDGKMKANQEFFEYLKCCFQDARDCIKDDNFLNVGIETAIENACYNSGVREILFKIWQDVEKYMNKPLEKGEE